MKFPQQTLTERIRRLFLTKTQRKNIRAALRVAKGYLWNGRADARGDLYICNALFEVIENCRKYPDPDLLWGAKYARKVIQSRLWVHNTNDFSKYARLRGEYLRHQQLRHAWIDALIEEYRP